jgi:hypothetical protein
LIRKLPTGELKQSDASRMDPQSLQWRSVALYGVRARRSSPPEGVGEEDRAGGESVDSQGRTPGVRKAVGTRPRAGSSGDFATLGGKARIGETPNGEKTPLPSTSRAERHVQRWVVWLWVIFDHVDARGSLSPSSLRGVGREHPLAHLGPVRAIPRCRDRRRIRVRATRTSWPRPPSRLGVEEGPSPPNMRPLSVLRNDLRQSNVHNTMTPRGSRGRREGEIGREKASVRREGVGRGGRVSRGRERGVVRECGLRRDGWVSWEIP